MKDLTKRIIWLSAPICLVLGVATTVAQTPAFKPKRINRAIGLLEQGQPIYHTGSHVGTAGSYDQGVKDAQTFANCISYDMEHAPYDIKGLADCGLIAGGPTKSGHRTPAVIVNLPVNGTDEAAVHANACMFGEVLAHGGPRDSSKRQGHAVNAIQTEI